jgi:hypothetical protein
MNNTTLSLKVIGYYAALASVVGCLSLITLVQGAQNVWYSRRISQLQQTQQHLKLTQRQYQTQLAQAQSLSQLSLVADAQGFTTVTRPTTLVVDSMVALR